MVYPNMCINGKLYYLNTLWNCSGIFIYCGIHFVKEKKIVSYVEHHMFVVVVCVCVGGGGGRTYLHFDFLCKHFTGIIM